MRRFTSQWYKLTALLCALLLCVLSVAPAVSAAPLASGNIGPLKWSLSGGTLSISGQGVIPNFTEYDPAPWYAHRESILRLELSNGIMLIGSMAFYDCTALVTVELPVSVRTVGDMAFAGCESMTTIQMPRVTALGRYAFSRCFALTNVMLPDTLGYMGDYCFYRCGSLPYIRIPASVKSMGHSAFAYCTSLLRADVEAPLSELPEWCFYGCERLQAVTLASATKTVGDSAFTRCDSLSTVYHGGTDADREALSGSIAESLPGFTVSQTAPATDVPPVVTNKDVVTEGNTMQETTTEITEKEDTVIRVEQTVTYPVTDGVTSGEPTDLDSTVHVTINGEKGWDTALDEIRDQINDVTSFESDHGEQDPVRAEITLQSNLPLTGGWLSNLAGRDVIVSVTTPDGSRFTIDGQHIVGYEFEESYQLTYSLIPCEHLSDADRAVVGTAPCWWLSFHSAFAFPITVEVFVDSYAPHQDTTLYEKLPDDSLLKLQSAKINSRGYAAFRMAVINTTTRYLLALNAFHIPPDEVLAPDDTDDLAEFLPLDERYSISEPRGFMGMTMKEFTGLVLKVVGAFVAVVLVCVLFFVIRGKRKAKIAAIRAKVMGTDALEEYNSPKKAKSFRELTKPSKKDKE